MSGKSYREYLEDYIYLCKAERRKRDLAKDNVRHIVVDLAISLIYIVLSISLMFQGVDSALKYFLVFVIIGLSVFTTLVIQERCELRASLSEAISRKCEAKKKFLNEVEEEALVNPNAKFFLWKMQYMNPKRFSDFGYVSFLCIEAYSVEKLLSASGC